jgi:hypothetical protein
MNNIIKQKGIYWALIGTFTVLYLLIASVSTLHAISFFQLANIGSLAIILGIAYEIGQSAILFSILMTNNKNRLLAWCMMFLLTTLQITANVYASFKFMDMHTGTDWKFWQRSILFWVEGQSEEMYKVIISWISGALLPIIALGMTALVADNIHLASEGEEKKEDISPEKIEEIVENKINKKLTEKNEKEENKELNLKNKIINFFNKEKQTEKVKEEVKENIKPLENKEEINKEQQIKNENVKNLKKQIIKTKKINPSNKIKGWHLMSEFVDKDFNVFNKGKFIKNDPKKKPTELKKA